MLNLKLESGRVHNRWRIEMTKFTTTRDEFTGDEWLQIIEIIDDMNVDRELTYDRDKFVRVSRTMVPKIVKLIKSEAHADLHSERSQKFELPVPKKLKGHMEAAVERYGFRVQSSEAIDGIANDQFRMGWKED